MEELKGERKMKQSLLLVVTALAGMVSCAQAELITIAIEAVVDSVEDNGPDDGYLDGLIGIGDTITGYYVYESTTSDSNPSDPAQGNYWHYSSPAGIFLMVGGFDFQTNSSNVEFLVAIRDNISPTEDRHVIYSYNNLNLSNDTSVDEISWTLIDSTGSVFSNDLLPSDAPVLEAWNDNYLRLDGERGGYIVDATVTSAIPEPITVLFITIGIGFLRKRKN